MPKSVALALLFCSLAFGQLESNSITVNASNNPTLQPDQAIFQVIVQSPITTGLDDILTALQGSGITAANLSNVNTQTAYNGSTSSLVLQWMFNLPSPLANTKATVASFTTLQQNIAKANNQLTLSFSIVGTQVSQQLAQSQTCSFSALIALATTQAQSLAAAGGLTLGSISALSGSTAYGISNPFGTASNCAITVTFAVARH